MPMFLDIEFGSAEKTGKKIELFDTRVRGTVAAQMENMQFLAFRVRFDQIVKYLDQFQYALLTAYQVVKRCAGTISVTVILNLMNGHKMLRGD
jgi:hypothetical protein